MASPMGPVSVALLALDPAEAASCLLGRTVSGERTTLGCGGENDWSAAKLAEVNAVKNAGTNITLLAT
ncbi:MAG: hypothetical protein ACREQA_18175 [Candidatus Binatia bacterium]